MPIHSPTPCKHEPGDSLQNQICFTSKARTAAFRSRACSNTLRAGRLPFVTLVRPSPRRPHQLSPPRLRRQARTLTCVSLEFKGYCCTCGSLGGKRAHPALAPSLNACMTVELQPPRPLPWPCCLDTSVSTLRLLPR